MSDYSEDKAQVRRMLAGDERAFAEFFDRHFPPLYRFALSRLRSDADLAEEIVQRTLCKAVRKLATYRGEAALLTWLCSICRFEIATHHRQAGRRPEAIDLVEEVPEIRAALETLSSAGETPEEVLQRHELRRLVQVALDHLPLRHGQALEWKYIEGLSVQEIAQRLESTTKATESLLTRARSSFRDGFRALMQSLGEGEPAMSTSEPLGAS